jgi:hypothetical protein
MLSPDLNVVRVQLSEMASRFLRLSPSFPACRPNFSSAFRGPRRRAENVCGAHFASTGYDGGKPKIPMMFPGCFHGTGKD